MGWRVEKEWKKVDTYMEMQRMGCVCTTRTIGYGGNKSQTCTKLTPKKKKGGDRRRLRGSIDGMGKTNAHVKKWCAVG